MERKLCARGSIRDLVFTRKIDLKLDSGKRENGKNKWSEGLIRDLVFTRKGSPKSDTWTGIHILSCQIDQIWAKPGLHQTVWFETRYLSRNTCILSACTVQFELWSSSAGLIRDSTLNQNMAIEWLDRLVSYLVFTRQTDSKSGTWIGIHILSCRIDQIWAKLGLHQAVWFKTRHLSRNTFVLSACTVQFELWSSSAGLIRDPTLNWNMPIEWLDRLVIYLVFTRQTDSKSDT